MSDRAPERERDRGSRNGRVRVQGTAGRWVPADHADVAFTVRRHAATSGEAVAQASAAYARLDGSLAGAGELVVRRTTVALTVHEVTRWDPETNREVREGFAASRTETVRFAPPAAAADVLRSIAIAVPDLALAGPWFGLRPENPVHDEVRAAASAEALRSARAYASGLGLSLGRVQRLTEPGLGGGGAGGLRPEARMAAAMMKDDAGGQPAPVLVDLTDEDVEVRATIDLDVDLAP